MRVFLLVFFVAELFVAGCAYNRNPGATLKIVSDVIAIFKSPPSAAPAGMLNQQLNSALAQITSSDTSTNSPGVAETPAPAAAPAPVPMPTPATITPPAPVIDPQAQAAEIANQFELKSVTYDEALAEAKKEHKQVLIDFTGSDWCPYCQDLDREVLSSRQFQTYSVSKFVFMVADYPHTTQVLTDTRIQNEMLQKKYGVGSYPTLLVADADGNEMGRVAGYTPGSGTDAVITGLKPYIKP